MNSNQAIVSEQNCGCPPEPKNNTNWFAIGIIVIIGFVMLSKEVHFEFNVKPKQGTNALPVSGTNGENVQPVNLVEELSEDLSVPLSSKKIPHIVFVLDPNYGKRKNIDPKIVKNAKQTISSYLERFGPVAVQEMNKYGVPASVTLAQGLLESDAGSSRLANQNNNHFGVKCFSKKCKPGHCANYTDDSHKDFFRKYGSVWESYRDHSLFLQKSRYKHLLSLGTKDYKGWAEGLRKAGYATDKRYANKLIKIIENLKLYKYDA